MSKIKKPMINQSVIRKYKPINSSTRGKKLVDKRCLWSGRPYAALTVPLKSSNGRNNQGRITSAHRSSSIHRSKYRIIDFHRSVDGLVGTVERIEYDPNRTAFIALIHSATGKFYILAPEGLQVGQTVMNGLGADILPGNTLQLNHMPIDTMIHNIELIPGCGGVFCRSAGTFAKLIGKEMGYALIRLPSTEVRKVPLECRATVGVLSNINHFHEVLGKAGRSRYVGRRPWVRGVAKNPVDHPNGGDTSGGKNFTNCNGNMPKGKKTRVRSMSDKMIIKKRTKGGK